MTHVLICGVTESGKTSLAKMLVENYRSCGVQTLVLDPMMDNGFTADYHTSDRAKFLQTVQASRKCAVFVDESGEMIGRYNDEMFWLATRARHYGHKCHFICQRGQQIAKTVRDQCSRLFLFKVSFDDAKLFSNEFAEIELRQANSLGKGQCYVAGAFRPLRKISVF